VLILKLVSDNLNFVAVVVGAEITSSSLADLLCALSWWSRISLDFVPVFCSGTSGWITGTKSRKIAFP
jgi:hypothetical protein